MLAPPCTDIDELCNRFGWYQNGLRTLLDVARGLAYLHARKPWVGEAALATPSEQVSGEQP